MQRKLSILSLTLVCLVAVAGAGCGSSEEERMAAQRAEDLEALKEDKAALDAKRAELRELRAELEARQEAEGEEAEPTEEAEPAEEAEAEGEAPAAEGEEDLEARVEALAEEVSALSEELNSRIVGWLNAAEMEPDVPPTQQQLEVIRMKSDEDLLIAREYIEKGGDYRRAIEIYQMALSLDPENERLQQALDAAERYRFMTEDRFAQAEKGMTEAEVEEVLGVVNLRNIRTFEDRGVVAWFYPKEEGGAAGVYFQDEDGQLQVYQLDFDAVKPGEQG